MCRGPYCGRRSYDRHIVMSLFFLYRVGDFIFGRLGDIISGRDIICHSPHFGRLRSTGELLDCLFESFWVRVIWPRRR